MTDNENLFVKYYNGEKVLISTMSYAEKKAHIEELESIVYEAKVRLKASTDDMIDENSKLKSSQKEWLKTRETPDQTTSDAVVTARKARMSKMDKLNEQLRAAGIDDDTRKQMIRDLEAKMTEKNTKSISFKSSKPVVKSESTILVASSEPVKVFDPSSLKFGTK